MIEFVLAAWLADAPADREPPPVEGPDVPESSERPADSGTAADAEAEGPRLSRHSLYYVNLLGMSTNPLGLTDEFRLGYRLRLIQRPGVLFEGTHLDVHGYTYATPAYVHVGPFLELAPLAILNFTARYTFVGYFSTFGLLQSFPTPTADYGPLTYNARADEGAAYATTGHTVVLSGRLQGKVGPVAARNELTTQWSKNRLHEGDTVFYEQTLDLLVPNGGWVILNDLDLLYLFDFGLILGARYTMAHAFYRDEDFLAGEEPDNPNSPHHRLGPAVLFQFFDRPGARFNTPTVAMLAQWWIRHRWRAGTDIHQAVPYFALAFVFEGQLWPKQPLRGKRR